MALAVWTLGGWISSHLLLLLLPNPEPVAPAQLFFQHVLLAISWGALEYNAIDIVVSTDIRATTNEPSDSIA